MTNKIIRYTIAGVLLFAALAKSHQLATAPSLPVGGWFGLLEVRRVQIVAIEFELFWAVLLISNPFPRLIWHGTAVLFAAFAVISAAKWWLGEASCGCFGRVEINPLYTAMFDVVVVGMVVLTSKHAAQNVENSARKGVITAIVWVAVSLPIMFAVHSVQEIDLPQLGTEIIGADGRKMVLLEPKKWVGKEFPLRYNTDMKNTLDSGLWLVLLHTHTCSSCRECVRLYSELVVEFAGNEKAPKIALLKLPPYDTEVAPSDVMVRGKLDKSHKWQIKSPILVLMDGGKVQNVFDNPLDTGLIRAIWGGEK